MPFTREQAVRELGELIATPPWGGGGAYPEGAKLLQNISPTSELWSQKGRNHLNDWKRKGAANPHVVADILLGILAAVAIPQYQNYVARVQAAEGFSLMSGAKTAVAEYRSTTGK